jgi:nitric oxide synthase-interacting protein
LGNFYDCRLTLAPAVDPVACPSGFVFSREAIIENLLEQKKENKRRLAAWEAAQADTVRRDAERAAVDREAALLAFDRRNHAGASDALATRLREAVNEEAEALLADKRVTVNVSSIAEREQRKAEVRSFWAASQAPEAASAPEKPDGVTRCSASGKKLRLKDLVPLKFTPVPGGAPWEFMDPVSRDPLTNASRLVVLKPTGDVVLESTWRRCIRDDWGWGGKTITDDDVMELQRGGTGFAEHDGEAVQASKHFALGAGNGLADRRGQNAGAGSLFGLRMD